MSVVVKYAATARHKQQAVVERLNLEIGKAINQLLTEKELATGKVAKDWRPYLRDILEVLNERVPNTKAIK